MQKNLTYQQYRSADVTLLTAVCCIFEALVTIAAIKWFPEQPYSVSIVYAFMALVAMRWGGHVTFTAVAGALAHCIAAGDNTKAYVVMLVGNACCLFVMFLHKLIGKQKIRNDAWLTALYVAVIFVFVSLGRFAMQLCFSVSPIDALRAVLYDVLSLVFSLVIVLICRKQDGLFEDQKTYLLRLDEERKRKQQN